MDQGTSLNGFTGGGTGFTYNKVHVIGANTNINFNDDSVFNELKIMPITPGQSFLNYSGNLKVNNTLVISGASYLNRIWWRPDVYGIAKTLTNNGTLTMSDVDFHYLICTGTTSWSGGTRIGDGGGNSNITFDVSRTLYWVAISGGNWYSTGSWSLSSGGASGEYPPLPQDSCIFDENSITSSSRTITVNFFTIGKNVNFSNIKNNPTIATSFGYSPRLYGDITLGTGATYTNNSQYFYMFSTSSATYTSNGKNWPMNFQMYLSNNSTLTLADDCNLFQIGLACGILNTNNKNLTCYYLNGVPGDIQTHGGVGIDLGSSIVTITGYNTTILDFNYSNISLSAGTSLIRFATRNAGYSNNSTLNFGGKTYYDVRFMNSTSPYYYVITGSSKFNSLTLTPSTSVASLFKFTDGTTQTVSGFTAVGSSGKLISMVGTGNAGWAITKTTTGTSCNDYLYLTGSTATPSNTFYAGANSTNVGGNSGWLFQACTNIKSVIEVLYSSAVSKVSGVSKSVISKISGLS